MKDRFIVLDYASLSAVAAVVHEGSFERAAERLGITPSAVSQRVRGFEERLGCVLVVRGQPCTPTARGRELCAHFDKVQLLESDLNYGFEPAQQQTGLAPAIKVAINADSLATWFPRAVATFANETGMFLEITLEDAGQTAERLRSGEVLGAVTSSPDPVAGCKTIALGSFHYAACASPGFVDRHFGSGFDASALARAPSMRFNRYDDLQARWARQVHDIGLCGPAHWIPSTQGFLDLALAGLAWGLQPAVLAQPYLDAGQLIELPPAVRIPVKLFWTVARLDTESLKRLTTAVRASAQSSF
jgi:LysR family transcriptional regulator, chromosome initiation inhibitor